MVAKKALAFGRRRLDCYQKSDFKLLQVIGARKLLVLKGIQK